ncbi:MAG TPA: zf-TFIIB domain-containing protein [Gemmatimonadaceae bacterium]|nr:zf-TFIIB domain-containing protein [Gemmatimonadaceae bacterium]
MKCPKCSGPLRPVTFGKTEIDRCETCAGLWFDMLEHEELRAVAGSEAIDTGTARDEFLDAKEDVMCPRDKARMVRMVDPARPHIWIESCPLCYGVFLDAGEFRELKNDPSFIERLLRRRRHRPLT